MDFVLVVQVREIYTETAKIQIGFTFLVLAHLGSPGKRAIKRARVRACVHVCVCVASYEFNYNIYLSSKIVFHFIYFNNHTKN